MRARQCRTTHNVGEVMERQSLPGTEVVQCRVHGDWYKCPHDNTIYSPTISAMWVIIIINTNIGLHSAN